MNIKQAKDEIKNAIDIYLLKDEFGEYRLSQSKQRPILLMGPPGIGKTAIMEQISREKEIGLVSYTITHHTRQSAIGLPFIAKKKYNKVEYSITEYTMSEIIASVHEKIEKSGLKEGILFIDEINCVSETLAPTMLQFLQQKTFGQHIVPEGWVIVSAGNPPEYNKNVKDFDVVTLDRVKKIDVFADYSVWKEYAYKNSVHSGIISYLDIKTNNFYRVESGIDGKEFVTARGWEDLSQTIALYEELDFEVNEELIYQYLQHKKVAKDFANYLDLYYKYEKDYNIDEIVSGKISEDKVAKLKGASFDEKISIISLLFDKINTSIKNSNIKDLFAVQLLKVLKELKTIMLKKTNSDKDANELLDKFIEKHEKDFLTKKSSRLLDNEEEKLILMSMNSLEDYQKLIKKSDNKNNKEAFEIIKTEFNKEVENRKKSIQTSSKYLDNGFKFIEKTFGESQEMVIFITELTMNYHTSKFITENGCEMYFKYNKELLFNEKQVKILKDINELEELMIII